MGVRNGEGYGSSVIDFGAEPFGEEAVEVCERRSDDVWEGPLNASSKGVKCWGVSDGVEMVGRIGEGGGSFCSHVCLLGYIPCRGLFALALWEGRAVPA